MSEITRRAREAARALRGRAPSTAGGPATGRSAATPQPRPEPEIVIETTEPVPSPDPSTTASAVPVGIRNASEWTWRLLLIGAGILVLLKGISLVSEVVFPVIIAVLLAALLDPVHQRLRGFLPRGLAAFVTVLGTLAVLVALFSFVVNQFAAQVGDIIDRVDQGVTDLRDWAESTFGLSENEISTWLSNAWEQVNAGGDLGRSAAQAGLTAGHIVTGFVLTMFTLFFFLYDGQRIWAWIVRLFPRGARSRALSSGRIAWGQLKSFTRATILVAAVDAAGIGLGAFALGVPFASGIALLTFLGAFIPIIGALLSGFIAVILALATEGPWVALGMLGVTILVQQAESHLLQPLLLGRAVRVHPLAVILGIATGVIVGGVFGALVAVPLIAVVNAVGHHLLSLDPTEIDDAHDLLSQAERDEVDRDVEEAETLSEIEPGESPYRT